MVAGGEVAGDLEHFEEMLPKSRYELRSTITDDVVGKTMVPKYFTHTDTCSVFTNNLHSIGQ